MSEIFAIVLAAGRGKRMQSNTPKVAHMLLKKPLLNWSIDAVIGAGIKYILVVISENPVLKQMITDSYKQPMVRFCYQINPLGTAHAVQCGLAALTIKSPINKKSDTSVVEDSSTEHSVPRPWDENDKILITCGDTPGIKSDTYQKLLQFHEQEQNAVTIIAFYAKNPFGYGRIVLNGEGDFFEIREEKDCSEEEKKGNLCNSGVMCANFDILDELLPEIKNKNQASEFYLTDLIHNAKKLGHKVGFIASDHESEFSGINTPEQLKFVEAALCAES